MAAKARHGHAITGQRSRVYDVWRGLRQRCDNPKATGYSDYGGRGITVWPDWNVFENFLQWALANGYQDHLLIERRDVHGNYDPSNCYWATTNIQAANKRKRVGKTSPYIGVAPNKSRWQSYVDYKGKRVNLGTYDTDLQAAQVRDDYVKANHLPHKLNF